MYERQNLTPWDQANGSCRADAWACSEKAWQKSCPVSACSYPEDWGKYLIEDRI